MRCPFGQQVAWNPARVAAMLGRRDQLFAISVVVLSAKLAKCDGPVKREEIDAFKRQFRIPPEAVRDIGRLFDQARDSADGFEPYAAQLGEAFADNRGMLEDVLTALFVIARADGPVNRREQDFLSRTHRGFAARPGRLGPRARRHAAPAGAATSRTRMRCSACPRRRATRRSRATWKRLMRENHPGQPGRARRAGRVHRPRQRQGGAHQRRLGPHQARARPVTLRIRDLPSPNQDERPAGTPIDMLILHYTGMQTAQEAIDRLRDPAARVSSHYVVDEDGGVLRLVPEERRAWHAGVSYLARPQRAERPLDRHRDRQSGP